MQVRKILWTIVHLLTGESARLNKFLAGGKCFTEIDPRRHTKSENFICRKKITSEIKSLPTMKPTGFANQFFQKSREESNLMGILGVNKEPSPTLFYKTSITLILKPTRKKCKKIKWQILSIDEIILNKTLTKSNWRRIHWDQFRVVLESRNF